METLAERNQDMQERGLADYTKAFKICFRDRKKVFFQIVYGDLKSPSQDAYFSTSAMEFNHIRSDYNRCGQSQEDLLKRRSLLNFFQKWDSKHLKTLTNNEYDEMMEDIEDLKEIVPFVETTSFDKLVKFDRELSR